MQNFRYKRITEPRTPHHLGAPASFPSFLACTGLIANGLQHSDSFTAASSTFHYLYWWGGSSMSTHTPTSKTHHPPYRHSTEVHPYGVDLPFPKLFPKLTVIVAEKLTTSTGRQVRLIFHVIADLLCMTPIPGNASVALVATTSSSTRAPSLVCKTVHACGLILARLS